MKTFPNSNTVNIGEELYSLLEANEDPILKAGQTVVELLKVTPDCQDYLLRFSNDFGSFNIGYFTKETIKSVSRWGMAHNQTMSLSPMETNPLIIEPIKLMPINS